MKRSIHLCAVMYVLSCAPPAFASETVVYRYDARGRLIKIERNGTVNNGVQTSYTQDKATNRKNVITTGSTNPPPL